MFPYAIFALFTASAALLFWRLSARTAMLATFLGGWLILPVGTFPPPLIRGELPWWIVGSALPSDMLVTKAWVVAGAALLWGGVFYGGRVARWRPAWIDVPMACWCLWPLVDGLLAASPAPGALTASLYVTGCWGVPWLLGRIWIVDAEDRVALLKALAWAGVALLPVAVVEGVASPFVYEALYGTHPFRADGMIRYVGYRPLGLFENGNQYGIWICLSALAAIWLAFMRGAGAHGRTGVPIAVAVAVTVTAAAVAAQSVGAVMLLVAGLAFLALRSRAFLRPLMIGGVAVIALAAAMHLSGVLPLQRIARETGVGQQMLGTMRDLGRGSLLWRVSQDTKVLPAIHDAPLAGQARWDWFRPFGTRPWGLAMLLVGQFGLIGLLLAFGSVLAPVAGILVRGAAYVAWERDAEAAALATIVLLAMADATLNSFIYMPAMLVAGAIAVRATPRREPVRPTRASG